MENLKRTTEEFKEMCIKVHGNTYDDSQIVYAGIDSKITVICPIPDHGAWSPKADNYVRGSGCPKCARQLTGSKNRKIDNFDLFLTRAGAIHGNKYTYTPVTYLINSTLLTIKCPDHGNFSQRVKQHLKGQGCPKCANEKNALRSKKYHSSEDFIDAVKPLQEDNITFENTVFTAIDAVTRLDCSLHGPFYKKAYQFIQGQGCPKCGWATTGKIKSLLAYPTNQHFIDKAILIHGNKYTFEKTIYKGAHKLITVTCPKHGDFSLKACAFINSEVGCPDCCHNVSKGEKQLQEFVETLGEPIIKNDKIVLAPKHVDIFIPTKNIAIEFNGVRWHSDKFSTKEEETYKQKALAEKGIRLISVFEDEWEERPLAIKSILTNLLGKPDKLMGRKTTVKEITFATAKDFLNLYHLQGSCTAGYYFGLYNKETLVSVMTFRKHKEGIELARYCSSATVIGGAKKLFMHFIKTHSPAKIVSFCDRRIFTGNMYQRLGFKLISEAPYNYQFLYRNKRYHRLTFTRKKLHKLFPEVPDTGSYTELLNACGIFHIHSIGNAKYLWTNN